jgi:hypothetical protein
MELQNDILTTGNDTLEMSEAPIMHTYFNITELAEIVWEQFEELKKTVALWADLVYESVEDKEVKQIKALLREMRIRVLKPIGSIKTLRRLLFSHVSLLFGLCSSQSSLILNAFYGNSLSRIPSL